MKKVARFIGQRTKRFFSRKNRGKIGPKEKLFRKLFHSQTTSGNETEPQVSCIFIYTKIGVKYLHPLTLFMTSNLDCSIIF
jgi:hypothetical protein